MAGTILENLSGRKLIVLVSVVLLCQIVCFLIGGCIAPAPSNVESVMGLRCLRKTPVELETFSSDPWNILRGKKNLPVNCDVMRDDLNDPKIVSNPNVTASKIVFAHQLPLPKAGYYLDYSRWMQSLITVLMLEIEYSKLYPMIGNPTLTMVVKLGYRNKWNDDTEWKLLADATVERKLECTIDGNHKEDGSIYSCEPLPLFELGSLHHDYYLINLILPVAGSNGKPLNEGIGYVKEVWVTAINQNGGFTQVWVSLKTVFFPIIIATMVWYWRRIALLARPPVLLERMLLSLGLSLSLLNLPIEFLTLWVEIPFMLLLSDIRQGIYYGTLLSFWLVFCGEHLMDGRKDDVDRNRLRSYWKHLSAVAVGCTCLFLFDMCERGVQLKNPFYSIWVSDLGTHVALAFIILAAISASLYFVFLCYMVYRVFRNIGFKRSALPSMSSTRRMFYEGIIYRFKFLMMTTLVCAAMTVISYILGQVSEGQWKWDDNVKLQYTSAFFTGVYGMWNLYVFSLLVLYAPSHKSYPPPGDLVSSSQEEIEFSRLTTSEHPTPSEPSEISALTDFAKKSALD